MVLKSLCVSNNHSPVTKGKTLSGVTGGMPFSITYIIYNHISVIKFVSHLLTRINMKYMLINML